MHDIGELLGAWGPFYVMMGSSAAGLTGLMFVVITLYNGTERAASRDGVSTFSTPTVFHFCCVLFTSAVLTAPLRSLTPIAILWALTGAVGLVYAGRVALRARSLPDYQPDIEDWSWHVLLPLFAYALLLVGALALHANPARALEVPAAAVILLIFVGIHNAWDVVTFLATRKDDD